MSATGPATLTARRSAFTDPADNIHIGSAPPRDDRPPPVPGRMPTLRTAPGIAPAIPPTVLPIIRLPPLPASPTPPDMLPQDDKPGLVRPRRWRRLVGWMLIWSALLHLLALLALLLLGSHQMPPQAREPVSITMMPDPDSGEPNEASAPPQGTIPVPPPSALAEPSPQPMPAPASPDETPAEPAPAPAPPPTPAPPAPPTPTPPAPAPPDPLDLYRRHLPPRPRHLSPTRHPPRTAPCPVAPHSGRAPSGCARARHHPRPPTPIPVAPSPTPPASIDVEPAPPPPPAATAPPGVATQRTASGASATDAT